MELRLQPTGLDKTCMQHKDVPIAARHCQGDEQLTGSAEHLSLHGCMRHMASHIWAVPLRPASPGQSRRSAAHTSRSVTRLFFSSSPMLARRSTHPGLTSGCVTYTLNLRMRARLPKSVSDSHTGTPPWDTHPCNCCKDTPACLDIID